MELQLFALLILLAVRVSGAISMADLWRRLRRHSMAVFAVALSLNIVPPLLMLFVGTSGDLPHRLQYLFEMVAGVLIFFGIASHVYPMSMRRTVQMCVAASVVGAIIFLGFTVPDRLIHVGEVVFLLAASAFLVTRHRDFIRAAGPSYHWALFYVVSAVFVYGSRALEAVWMTPLIDWAAEITLSVALAIYLLNMEFNVAFIELEESERKYRTLFNAANDSIYMVALDGTIIDANSSAYQKLGYPMGQLTGMNLRDIDDPVTAEKTPQRMEELTRWGCSVFEARHVRRDDTTFPVEVSARVVKWGNRRAIMAVARDITERKRADDLIAQMAYYDALTGLANRRLLNDRLTVAIAHAHRTGQGLALFFLDIDNFKSVNDTLGHEAGDQLLSGIAERLQALVREDDTVARLGGDEFMLLLGGFASREDAGEIALKVLEALRPPFLIGGHEIHATTSIGVVVSVGGEADAEELLRNADIAMYRAKERGRNTYQFYDPEINAEALERFRLKNDLRRAMEGGQLSLVFQPQVSLTTGRVTAAEALIRWNHPEHGAVPPSRFIPLAEEMGLIGPIGAWVLDEACHCARGWQQAGFPDVRVAVNLSARQLLEPDFLETVASVLDDSRLAPSDLELEITESIAMSHPTSVSHVFHALGKLGVQVAIDDFGTGYSSLERLKSFPVHTLKIAQPFIESIDEDGDSLAIVNTIIALARNLRLRVVAEGVELESQRSRLCTLGCDTIQGYLFSRPVPPEDLLELLQSQSARPVGELAG